MPNLDIERMFGYYLGTMFDMKRERTAKDPVTAAVGFALGDGPDGVAFVALDRAIAGGATATGVIRVPFSCRAMPALEGRDAAYAAMLAVVAELRRRRVDHVRIETEARSLVDDHLSRRGVPAALSVPYVMLGCALNRFSRVELVVSTGRCRDLTARARADASLHVAA